MTSLEHLLAATDRSELSLRAVDRGFLLARDSGARFTVMQALALGPLEELRNWLGDQTTTLSHAIEAEARAALAQIVGDPARNHGVAAEIRLEPGLALAAVPQCARELGADLVLVGAHGESFLPRMLLGSTVSRLLRKSTCPVLVVKKPAAAPYRRVLIPIDFSPGSALAVTHARRVAPDAHLELLHVFEVPFEGKMQFAGVSKDLIEQYRSEARQHASRRLHEMAAAIGLDAGGYTGVVLHGDAVQETLGEALRHDHDLIAMGKHGAHLSEELLLGSVTKRVLAASQCDVLVVVDTSPAEVEQIAP